MGSTKRTLLENSNILSRANIYKIQMDHALLPCRLLKKAVKVIISTADVPKETLKDMFVGPVDTP